MKVLVICASDDEFNGYKKELSSYKLSKLYGLDFLRSWVKGAVVYVLKTGIGKVAAASATALILSRKKFDLIINAGLAGCPFKDVAPGTVFICNKFIENDFDLTPLGVPANVPVSTSGNFLFLYGGDSHKNSTLLTSDRFLTSFTKEQLDTGFSVCDMEGAAVVRVREMLAPDSRLLVLKTVSDNGSSEEYNSNLSLCSSLASRVVKIISSLHSFLFRV